MPAAAETRGGRERLYVPEKDPSRRIVVIGMAAVTPLGLDVDTTFRNMLDGVSGISAYDDPQTRVKVAGLVKGFDPVERLKQVLSDNPQKDLSRMSESVQYAVDGTLRAMTDAGLLTDRAKLRDDLPGVSSEDIGVIMGTGIGGALRIAPAARLIEERGRGAADDLFQMLLERTSSVPEIRIGLNGPVFTVTAACATGNIAIGVGADQITLGNAKIMVVGGVESATDYVSLELFRASGALTRSDNPSTACRPWDKDRKGFIFGQGYGVVVLSRLDVARAIGASIYAQFAGHGEAGDAYHDTAPHPQARGQILALRKMLAKVPEENLQGNILLDAHATSTTLGDETEVTAVKTVLTEEQLSKTVFSAPKGTLSHTMGAAGAVEAIVGIKAMNEGVIFPNVNLDNPIKEIEGLNVPTKPVERETDLVVNDSFGFGGINSVTGFIPFEERE